LKIPDQKVIKNHQFQSIAQSREKMFPEHGKKLIFHPSSELETERWLQNNKELPRLFGLKPESITRYLRHNRNLFYTFFNLLQQN